MAISPNFKTYGLLDEFRKHNLINQWWFNQIDGDSVPEYGCLGFTQYARDYYARELRYAFNRVKTALNFAPLPVYEVKERIDLKGRGLNQVMCTKYGFIQSFGVRAITSLEAGASVAYSKSVADFPDNDQATITATVPVGTAPEEIKVYFQVSDGGIEASPLYEIMPLTVVVSGTVATIAGHRSLFVKPSIWSQSYKLPGNEELSVNYAISSNADHFVTAVDVFRVYSNSTTAVEAIDYKGNRGTLTPYLINAEEGEFTVELDNAVNLTAQVSHVEVSYRAGKPEASGFYENDLIKAVCHLANTNVLTADHGNCLDNNTIWNTDNTAYEDERDVDFEFGRKHGQKEAWRLIETHKLYKGGFST